MKTVLLLLTLALSANGQIQQLHDVGPAHTIISKWTEDKLIPGDQIFAYVNWTNANGVRDDAWGVMTTNGPVWSFSTNAQPFEIVGLLSQSGTLINTVNYLCTSGEFCRVMGHKWRFCHCEDPYTRKCLLCGLQQHQEKDGGGWVDSKLEVIEVQGHVRADMERHNQ